MPVYWQAADLVVIGARRRRPFALADSEGGGAPSGALTHAGLSAGEQIGSACASR
jgi:hypothetical protein